MQVVSPQHTECDVFFRVRHLILADPWGFPEKPTEKDGRLSVPWYIRTIAHLLSPFNPLAGLRAMGPWGKHLFVGNQMKNIRSTLLVFPNF